MNSELTLSKVLEGPGADLYLRASLARPTAEVSPMQKAAAGAPPSPARLPLRGLTLRTPLNRTIMLTLMLTEALNQRPL